MAPRKRRYGPPWPGQSPLTPGPLGPLVPPAPPTVIPAFAAGYPYQGPDLDQLITAPLQALSRLPMFRAVLAGGQSISGATATIIQFDTILEDPFGGWSQAGTGTQGIWSWQPPFDGIYEIHVGVVAGATPIFNLVAGYAVSGAQFNPLDSTQMAGIAGGAAGSIMKPMAGGADYVQGFTWGSSAFSLAAGNVARETSMEIIMVSL